jgi:hypothetical protein
VTARISSPSLGASSYQEQGKWTAALSHRWQYSDRHFVGPDDQVYRTREGSEVINDVHLIDMGASYQISKRFSLSLSVPYSKATRSQSLTDPRFLRDAAGNPVTYVDAGGTRRNVFLNPSGVQRPNGTTNGAVIARYQTEANGLGDIKLLATGWIFDPETSKKGNISVGLGVLFPTGEKDVIDIPKRTVVTRGGAGVNDTFVVENGPAVYVDNSIQPGAGAWGIIFDFYAFRQMITNVTLFASGTYIATPQTDAGVISGATTGTTIWSVGDSYLLRAGGGYTFWPKAGLTLTLAGRAEGSPATDIIGENTGRRRPGHAVSIEPGIVWAKNGWVASFSAPVALYRNRTTSYGDDEPGDAAFADFMTLFSVSKSF